MFCYNVFSIHNIVVTLHIIQVCILQYYHVIILYCSIVVPHITDTIQEWVERVAKIPVDKDGEQPQVCVIEVSVFKRNYISLNFLFLAWWYYW